MANTGATTFVAVFSAVSAGLLGWIGLGMNRQQDIAAQNAQRTEAALNQLAEVNLAPVGSRTPGYLGAFACPPQQ
jgi:hypothetical protein